MHKLGVAEITITLIAHAQRQIQVELDAELSNLGDSCKEKRAGESWALRPRRSESVALFVSGSLAVKLVRR